MFDNNYWLWLFVMAFLIGTGLFFLLLILFFIWAAFKWSSINSGSGSHLSDNNAQNDGIDD